MWHQLQLEGDNITTALLVISREYDTTLFLVSVSVRFFEVSVSESFQSEIRYRYRKKSIVLSKNGEKVSETFKLTSRLTSYQVLAFIQKHVS